jgi:hypothetical protein
MWTASGLGSNADPQQQVKQQHLRGPKLPNQFQHTSYNMMPLQQTTISRTPTTNNTKSNTRNETQTTNYTWQQIKTSKILKR